MTGVRPYIFFACRWAQAVSSYQRWHFERRIVETAMRRRTFLRAAGAAALLAQRVPAAGKQYFVYWGTYTTSLPRFGNGESKGIYVSRLNSETGKLSTPELAAETKSPSYLAVHPSGRL